MRRSFSHPLTSAILLALLLADLWFLPYAQSIGGYSTASAFLRYRIISSPSLLPQPRVPGDAYFLHNKDRPGEFLVVRPDDESWGEVSHALSHSRGGWRDCLELTYRPITVRRGFWAPTTQVDHHEIKFQFGENFSESERAAARRQFVEESGAADILSFKDFQTLTTTDIDRTRPIYLGYVHNTLAAFVLIAFAVSLAWVPRVPAYIRAKVGARRLAAGLCPRCRYNLAGLQLSVCPECGETNLRPRSDKLKSEPGST